MTADPLVAARERARLLREDCARDAEALDRTPFTPQGIGPVLGSMLAQIAALAKCIEELADVLGPDDAIGSRKAAS